MPYLCTKRSLIPDMNNPLISVLMTAYNRERYIGEAIESVLSSTYKNFELIIVDDCSTDNTVSIAEEFRRTDCRIRLYVNQKNLGDYGNRNIAASYARGEYIKYLDSDDKILVDGIEKCVKAMLQFPKSSFGMMLLNKRSEPFQIASDEVIRKHFFEQQVLNIGPGGTILKRSFFERIGGYPVKYGPANDMYFNLKAASNSNMVMLPFDFLFYRIHDGQEINNKDGYLYNNYLYLKDALNELQLGLSKKEVHWISSKNKRRFLTNVLKYWRSTLNFQNTINLFRHTQFGIKDILSAIYH